MRHLYSIAIPALVTAVSLDALPTVPSLMLNRPVVNGIVAVDDGTLFFADGFQRTVWRLTRDGRLSAELTSVDAGALEVDAAGAVRVRASALRVTARAPGGELIVATGSSVLRVGPEGNPTVLAPGDPLLAPRPSLMRRLGGGGPHLTGVAVDAHGTVYVANASRGIIVRITVDGRTGVVERSESGWSAAGLAAANGEVYVLENGYGVRVRKLGSTGAVGAASWVRPGRTARGPGAGGRIVL